MGIRRRWVTDFGVVLGCASDREYPVADQASTHTLTESDEHFANVIGTPSPPFVIASSTPWLAVAKNKTRIGKIVRC
jgi:hypothetical protein